MISAKDFIRWCLLESICFEDLVVVDIDSDFDYVSFFGAPPTLLVPPGLCVALWSDLGLEPYLEINGARFPVAADAFIIRPNESIALYRLA